MGQVKELMCNVLIDKVKEKIQSWRSKFLSLLGIFGGPKTTDKKMHWVSWVEMTKSKKSGGRSFKELEFFNQALFSKIGWRLIQSLDSLCSKVLEGIYYSFTTFLNTKGLQSHHGYGVAYSMEEEL